MLKHCAALLIAAVVLGAGSSALSQQRGAQRGASAVSFGIQQRGDQPSDPENPFASGDLTYLLAYEYHEGSAFWQLGIGYTPYASSTSFVDEVGAVVTPQLHLVYRANTFLFGIGVMKHHMNLEGGNALWSGFYWQIQAGLSLPVSRAIEVRANATYAFRNWGDIGDLDLDEMEIGFHACYHF